MASILQVSADRCTALVALAPMFYSPSARADMTADEMLTACEDVLRTLQDHGPIVLCSEIVKRLGYAGGFMLAVLQRFARRGGAFPLVSVRGVAATWDP
jgi:hypothetical protein